MLLYLPTQQLLPWKISITVLHAIATLTTCLRYERRRRIKKLWWDDRAAIVPAVVQILNITVLWLRMRNHPNTPLKMKVFYSYSNSFCFGTILWWSRISLALTILRITPVWSRCRGFTVFMTCAFFVFWISLVLGMIVTCAVHTQWQHAQTPILICGPTYYVAIVVVILDIIGDVALIGIPLRLLWRLKHPSSHRRHVLLVFSASTLTLLSSIIFCVASYAKFIGGPGRLVVWIMICQMTEAISIITSNLLVLICWFRHHFLHDPSSLDVDDFPQGDAGGDIHFTPATNSSLSLKLDAQGRVNSLNSSREGHWENNNGGILYQTQDTVSSWWSKN